MFNVKEKKFWTDGWGSVFLAILAALTIRWALLEAYVIPSGSMLPTLLVHDHIFVNKIIYGLRTPFTSSWLFKMEEPKRGEVIVFRNPADNGIFYIKRLIGVPGDEVFYEEGNLYVNDRFIERKVPQTKANEFNWLKPAEKWANYEHWEETLNEKPYSVLLIKNYPRDNYGPVRVPEDHFFVMGDNRDNSKDSRRISFIHRDLLIGRASFIWLSCDEKLKYVPFLCNPLTIRLTRFFRSIE